MNYLLVALSITVPLKAGWAEQTLKNLSLREKIGQLCIVATASDFSEENRALSRKFGLDIEAMKPASIEQLIQEYAIGGLIFLLRSTSEKQITLSNHYQALSKTPLLICQDAENGLIQRHTDALGFPNNMTLGAIQDEQLIYHMALEVGRQCKSIGVHMNFAPVVDVNNNPDNPVINDRSFGEDKKRVARLGELFAKGLHTAGVIPCAKHFPGHGDIDIDSHLSLPTITHDKKRLASVELYPFKYLIQRDIPAIMTAHLSIPVYDPGIPSSLSHKMVTELLQHELGFTGLVITDSLMMKAVTNHFEPGILELKAFLAGNDILLCPTDVPKAIDAIEQAIIKGTISEEELNRRVLKILKAKESVGLSQETFIQQPVLSTPEAVELKKNLYEQAITVIGNTSILPASPSTPVIQIGGEKGPFAEAFEKVYHLTSHENTYDELLHSLQDEQHIIVGLFGMSRNARDNYGITESTLALIKELKKKHEVIITLFGNPYSLRNFDDTFALVVAYEDDPDAQYAAAQVILGELEARGTLPVAR